MIATRRAGQRRMLSCGTIGIVVTATLLTGASGCAHAPRDEGELGEPRTYVIEKPAMGYPTNPRPRYPAELFPTGDTGTVRIRVAVEKNGTADKKSVTVVESPHPAFTREVLAVLPDYRFFPAEVGTWPPRGCRPASTPQVLVCPDKDPSGKKLRSEVEMAFVFVVPPPM